MIGYYIHHHGRGHIERARAITAHLDDKVTGLSSLPRPDGWPGEWIELDWDLVEQQACEPTADGALHWAPLRHNGLRKRMGQIAEWIEAEDPSAIVCDVSVEVAALARLMGVPAISVAMPGVRDDAPHTLGYQVSSAIIAPWPAEPPPIEWPARWRQKTYAVGAFSRFDGRPCPPAMDVEGGHDVTVLWGAGGTQVSEDQLDAAAAATPGWQWSALGPARWIDDPWPELCRADVVITHAGQNCISEVAAARRAAIVVPQARPYDEQLITARMLERQHLAIVSYSWPEPGAWATLLQSARTLGGERWASWSSGEGARRAARVIEAVAGGVPVAA